MKSKTQQVTSWLVSERIARGLTPAYDLPKCSILNTKKGPSMLDEAGVRYGEAVSACAQPFRKGFGK